MNYEERVREILASWFDKVQPVAGIDVPYKTPPTTDATEAILSLITEARIEELQALKVEIRNDLNMAAADGDNIMAHAFNHCLLKILNRLPELEAKK